jgi:hypothetical protein
VIIKMEVIRQGSDMVNEVGPLSCCYPAGTMGPRFI